MKSIKWLSIACACALVAFTVTVAAQNLSLTHNANIEYVGPDSAEIAWTTNTGGSSVIHYGTDPNNLNQTAEEPYQSGQGGQHVTHRVLIKNLQPNTTYYFRVESAQGQGTGTETEGEVHSFHTKNKGEHGSRGENYGPASANSQQQSGADGSKVPLYRALSSDGDHFYTTDSGELQKAISSASYRSEGVAGYLMSSQVSGTEPLYRLYQPASGDHFYTTNPSERQSALGSGYHEEGIVGYVAQTQLPGTVPLYRLFNGKHHFYTTNTAEVQSAMQKGWHQEGISGYIWTQ